MHRHVIVVGPVVAWMLLGFAGSASAQQDDGADDLFDMSIEDLLATELVTAGATPSPRAEAPSHVYVITRQQILRRGYRSLLDALDEVPQIQVHRRASAETREVLSLRGITENHKFIVLIDGHRLSSPAGTPTSLGPSFSLANVDRIEVLLGPASALYGADAFSGVIQIITRSGEDVGGVELTTSAGRYGTVDASLVTGSKLGEVDMTLSGSFYASSGPDLSDAWPEDYAWHRGPYQQGKILGFGDPDDPSTWTDVPVEPFSMPTTAYFIDGRMRWRGVEVGFVRHSDTHSSATATRPTDSLYVDDAEYGWTIQTAFFRGETRLFDDRLTVSTHGNVSTYEVDPDSRFLNKFSQFQGGFKYEQSLVVRVEQRVGWSFGDWLSLNGGLAWHDFSGQPKSADLERPYDPSKAADSQDLVYPGTSISQNFYSYRYQNYGGWLELHSNPLDWLSITAGARVDHNTRYGTSGVPRVGFAFRPTDSTSLKLLYGEAFLAPSPYETWQHFGSFFVSPETGRLASNFWRVPNENLEPERLRTFEVVATQRVGGLLFSLNGYLSQARNLITPEPFADETFLGIPVSTISRPINGGKALLYGGTARAEFSWSHGDFRLNPWVAYTFSDGQTERAGRDVRIPFNARHVVKGGLDFGWRGLSTSLQVEGRSGAVHREQFDEAGDPETIDGYAVAHLNLRYQDAWRDEWGAMSVWVRVTNLTNARYRNVSFGTDTFPGAPQDPIRAQGGIELKF